MESISKKVENVFTIRRKLGIILVTCSITAVLLSALLVNITVNSMFNKYMSDIQVKRYDTIVNYFQELYKRDKKWTISSGAELMHEAYMSNYCLTLLDADKKLIWTMNPDDIKFKTHVMNVKDSGIYTTKTFEIKYVDNTAGYIEVGQYSPILLSEEDINFKLSINKSIVISVIVTILLAIIFSLLISKQFSTPIKEVSDTSVKLSRGNYSARSDAKTDILELKNLIGSINDLGEKLENQDMIRKRLISDITHEIRAPLNILQNNLEAMVDGVFDVTNERLVSLNDEVIRFGKLLNNLDVLKGLEGGDATLNMNEIHIDALIMRVIKDFSIALDNKNIKLTLSQEQDCMYAVMGDSDSLKQVFINILSNAVKFTQYGGNIWVDLKEDKSHVIIQIKDDGIGINKEDMPFIFERLYRGDKSRNIIEGSGIGLTVVKKILMLHYATINIESEPDLGTTVTTCFNKLDT